MHNNHGVVRKMQASDIEQVLSWRNHPDVRAYMYTQHEITLTEHQAWFASASQDKKRDLLIFELHDIPQGFVQIKQHDNLHIADWGFYLAPGTGKGTGRLLGTAALDFAFIQRGLHKVCGEALGYNEKSIRFHLGLGFQQEGILREQHFDGSKFHDIYCFGLLANEWHNKNTAGNDDEKQQI